MKLIFFLVFSVMVSRTLALVIPSADEAPNNSCADVHKRAKIVTPGPRRRLDASHYDSVKSPKAQSTLTSFREKIHKTFTDLKHHIFKGEEKNPRSGRHMLKVWCAANKGSQGICNTESKLCIFDSKKTVWDDRPGGYTEADVTEMCKDAISENIRSGGRLHDRTFAVKAQFGGKRQRAICVSHQVASDQHSCYPLGINFRKDIAAMGGLKIGSQCPAGGTGNEVDQRAREEKVQCKDVK